MRAAICTAAVVAGLASWLIHAAAALAQARIEASRERCMTLHALVQERGRVLIYTGPYLYDYYVANCGIGQRNIPAYLATRDNPQCFVGYNCLYGQ
jgi:hypothetical protein